VLDLQFGDLKELDIPSFGKRHQIWNTLGSLRADGGISPACTEFRDVGGSCTSNTRSKSLRERSHSRTCIGDLRAGLSDGPKRHARRKWNTFDDGITPAQSVSMVATEQLIPKPHRCSKGENCPKCKKQQRLLDQLDKEHGFSISPIYGGSVFIAGNPGNAEYAENIVESVVRPTSEAVPSAIASSDLLGPGQRPGFALQEETLRNLEKRDPQENVRQFLTLQHMQSATDISPISSAESPKYEMFPLMPMPIPPSASIPALRQLPRLEIPWSASANARTAVSPCSNVFSPRGNLRRLGTPASEMDVPLTAIPLPPVSRNASQSVPPNMQFRAQKHQRAGSRDPSSWRRRSYALPTLPENTAQGENGRSLLSPQHDKAHSIYGGSTTQAGWMKKRKTKLLRHEWNEAHFRLNGTQLAMHASALDDKALDTIDVENFAIACSTLASNSKLAAALKSLRITAGKKDVRLDEAAFAFQLIPAAERARRVGLLVEGAKTHHFAVKSRDERIDWMREVMLAKALRQKGDGHEVIINGQVA